MGTISFKIYPNLKLAHFQGLGDISHDMLISQIRQLHRHPDWNFSFNTFIDFEKAVVNTKTECISRIQSFLETLQLTAPVRKWAIYTCQDAPRKAFDMSRLSHMRNIIIDVFQSRNEALKFLNVLPQQLADATGAE
jgi:hypothetical protein